MKLYFGNTVTTVTTLMILSLLTFIGYSVYYRDTVTRWGLRSAVLLVFGLSVCCFAAARDGLDKTIQHAVRRQLCSGDFPSCEHSEPRRLCRRPAHSHRRRRNADRKDAKDAGNLVLRHVVRRGIEDCDRRDRKNFS